MIQIDTDTLILSFHKKTFHNRANKNFGHLDSFPCCNFSLLILDKRSVIGKTSSSDQDFLAKMPENLNEYDSRSW